MARLLVHEGVQVVACTPHIMPGVFNNTGEDIKRRVKQLQDSLDRAGISLTLVSGADVHVAPDLVQGIRTGRILTLHDTKYILVEPPHNVAPPRLEDMFFDLSVAGFVPVLTHPERLRWIESGYQKICRLCQAGAWMQLTAGSLLGMFGDRPKYWAERMLAEGRVHILATDAHNSMRRRPVLRAAFEKAAMLVGENEANRLVVDRPYLILNDAPPSEMPPPVPTSGAPDSKKGLLSRVTRIWKSGKT